MWNFINLGPGRTLPCDKCYGLDMFNPYLVDRPGGQTSLFQLHGRGILGVKFRLARSWIWAAHRKLLGFNMYLV